MPKIAMIGAGSIVFAKTLFKDICATPALRDSEFRFMSRTTTKLERLKAYADRVIAENSLKATAMITTDRREALKDADFVIAMLQTQKNRPRKSHAGFLTVPLATCLTWLQADRQITTG